MAFKTVNTTLTTNETILYTAPVGVDGVVFSGIIANSSTSQETITVTLRITNNSTVTYILNEVPIIFGGSLTIPKVVVKPGASLSGIAVGAESNKAVDITFSILERPTSTVIDGQEYVVPPVDHASEDTTYGPATNATYGHVKGDGTTINITNGVASLNAYFLGIDDVYYSRPSLFTTKKTTVTIPAYTTFRINGELYSTTQPVTLNTSKIKEAGKDAYIYATVSEGNTLGFALSKNSTVPDGFNAQNSRKIGGFHMLCANVGTIAGHPLSGYVAGDILPASCWDLKHRPISDPEGMVYDSGLGLWVDIYLDSWNGSKLTSTFGGTTADGTSSKNFHGELYVEELANIGKRLPWRNEFMHFAKGSNECTNITGSADPTTTGGHTDTAGRRMISNIGCEDCCGALWQWTSDIVEGGAYGTISAATNWFLSGYNWSSSMIDPDAEDPTTVADPVFQTNIDGTTHYGNAYGLPRRLLVGGRWGTSSRCGSRSVHCCNFSAARSSTYGGRGVSAPRPQGL